MSRLRGLLSQSHKPDDYSLYCNKAHRYLAAMGPFNNLHVFQRLAHTDLHIPQFLVAAEVRAAALPVALGPAQQTWWPASVGPQPLVHCPCQLGRWTAGAAPQWSGSCQIPIDAADELCGSEGRFQNRITLSSSWSGRD